MPVTLNQSKMRRMIRFLLILVAPQLFSCQIEDVLKENRYEDCCGTAPLELDFNPGKVYVANIFSPDGDGVNDYFYIQADPGIEIIEEFLINDRNGDVIFQKYNIPPNNYIDSWSPLEDQKAGLYEYTLKIRTINSQVFDGWGSVCLFRCEDAELFDVNEITCGFPLQHDGEGGFEINLNPNQECQ